jgi:diadenosine tetraphosphatase ApaH/serine/threonine PP2A family protein phosphatase
MQYAIFSDIHANLEALEAVLDDISQQGVGKLICLGDIVGYGASPNECVARVIGSGATVVLGNHDHAAIGVLDITYFNDYARAAILWTRAELTPASFEFLGGLPYVLTEPGVRFVHASPRVPEDWDYVLSIQQAVEQLESFEEPICFIGHSHYPGLYRQDGNRVMELEFPANTPVSLGAGRHLVNVGSVGQPRDNDSRAAWALYDDETRTLTLRRVEYPVSTAQERILEAHLPTFLAHRLGAGI